MDALILEFGPSLDVTSITVQGVDEVKAIILNKIIPGINESTLNNIIDIGVENGKEVFWTSFNKPFLEAAFRRGDNIRLFSDPVVYRTDLGFYGRELEEITRPGGLAEQYGYIFDVSTGSYIKQ